MGRRINLLPPELLARRQMRQMMAGLGVAGIALVVLLAVFYGVQDVRLRGERGRLDRQKAANAVLTRRVASLSEFASLQDEVARRSRILEFVTTNEVRWSAVLADVSLVIPSNVWLTGFTGSVQAPAPAPKGGPAAAGPTTYGQIQFGGLTFQHIDVARWLSKLAEVNEFTNPYLSLSSKAPGAGGQVQFNSSVLLSEKALRRNQRGAARKI